MCVWESFVDFGKTGDWHRPDSIMRTDVDLVIVGGRISRKTEAFIIMLMSRLNGALDKLEEEKGDGKGQGRKHLDHYSTA